MKDQPQHDWERIYEETPVEEMPWYYPELDPDLEKALKERNIRPGIFLDLGTGPGTQAIELATRGFVVTATDISKSAITKAAKLSYDVRFVHDDVLKSKIYQRFDYVLDRGCFHVMSEEERSGYVKTVGRLLKRGGLLFLKGFSDKEPETGRGPYRFSKEMIMQIFAGSFDILNIHDTRFPGATRTPISLFVSMRRK